MVESAVEIFQAERFAGINLVAVFVEQFLASEFVIQFLESEFVAMFPVSAYVIRFPIKNKSAATSLAIVKNATRLQAAITVNKWLTKKMFVTMSLAIEMKTTNVERQFKFLTKY